MTSDPQVTVAIPTWNRSGLLAETIRSVLDQTLTQFELRVLDDASTDDTAHVVASFPDARLQYHRAEQRLGLHGNLTRCLKIGDAPYVAICQDDDVLDHRHLEHLVAVLDQNSRVGLVHAAFHMIDRAGRVLSEKVDWFGGGPSRIESGDAFVDRSFATGCRINMSAAVIRRSVVDQLAFEEADGPGTDFGLWLRLAQRADVAFVSEPLALWRIHTGSVSNLAGLYDVGRGPAATFELIANAKTVKERFLRESGFDAGRTRRLKNSSHRHTRQALLNLVTRNSLPGRSFSDTWHLLRQAVRIEPSLLWHGKTVRVLLASLAGKRARSLVQRMRNSPKAPRS